MERDAATTSDPRATHFPRLWFQGVRITLIAIIAWISWTAMGSLQTLLTAREPAQASRGMAPTASMAEESFLKNLAFTRDEGYWTFAGWDWSIGRTEVAQDRLDERLDILGTRGLGILRTSQDNEQQLIETLRQISPEVKPVDGREVFCMESPEARLQVVAVETNGLARLQSAALALRAADDQWQLWELMPADGLKATTHQAVEGHLLPLPKEAEQLIGRWSPGDQLQLEIVTLVESAEKLNEQWRSDGWIIRKPGPELAMPGRLWQRGDRTVYTWTPNTGKYVRTLVLVDMSEQ